MTRTCVHVAVQVGERARVRVHARAYKVECSECLDLESSRESRGGSTRMAKEGDSFFSENKFENDCKEASKPKNIETIVEK